MNVSLVATHVSRSCWGSIAQEGALADWELGAFRYQLGGRRECTPAATMWQRYSWGSAFDSAAARCWVM